MWPMGEELMDLASWTLGLSLIVLTIAIHTTGVVMMAFGLETRIRVRVDKHKHDPRRAIPAVIGHIAAVALILAALHGRGDGHPQIGGSLNAATGAMISQSGNGPTGGAATPAMEGP
jgi:hypothetical protein